MIGSALKKIAKSYGMTKKEGYAYGEVLGYLMTFDEGMGYKRIDVALALANGDDRRETISGFINESKAYYKISDYKIYDSYLEVYFFDTIGTKQRIVEFIGAISKKLSQLSIPQGKTCSVCFSEKEETIKVIKINNAAVYAHESCSSNIEKAVQSHNELFAAEKKNHLSGALGALIGGLVGTIPWILVYMLGFFVGWLGFVIGLAANKGYVLFKGKNSKLKPWIIIFTVIICVVVAQFVAESIEVVKYFSAEGYMNYSFGDVARTIIYTFRDVPEYKSAIIGNIGLGFLFAGLGVLNLIKTLTMESKDQKLSVIK